ncbi:MAG TPA: sulfite exporter TauE/SafE family protein [Rhizomicrobium sp.]
MNELGQLSPAAWHTALCTARHRRTEHFRKSLGPLRFRLSRTGIFLVGMALVCATLVGHHDGHPDIIMVSVGLASLVSSLAGFAFSAICGAMLFHVSDNPVQVVQIMIICSIANQAAMTWSSRRDIRWRELGVYLAGGLVGLAAGVWLLLHADRARYAPALGVFLLLYGGYMFLRRPAVIHRQHAVLDFAAGVLGGITGGAAGFPGAFVTIWCGMKGWEKAHQRAVFQPFILIMQVLALLSISFMRHQSAGGAGFDLTDLLFVPISLLGTSAGLALYRRLSDGQFARAVNILLIISGLSYIM